MAKNYTLDECILVLDLYRRLGGSNGRYNQNSESVRQMSEFISQYITKRNPKSISNKLDNFRYEDTGVHGLSNGGHMTAFAWNMCKNMTDEQLKSLANEICDRASYRRSEEFDDFGEINLDDETFIESAMEKSKPGYEREYVGWARVNQNVFRVRVVTNFNEQCCITGIGGKCILRASHIRPWKKCNEHDKTSVRNGLCLNPLHDSAFDKGLFTLDDDYRIILSSDLEKVVNNHTFETVFHHYEGKRIAESNIPVGQEYLRYHRRYVFQDSSPRNKIKV